MVAWSNLVSAQGPLVLGLGLKGLGLRVWGQGLTIFATKILAEEKKKLGHKGKRKIKSHLDEESCLALKPEPEPDPGQTLAQVLGRSEGIKTGTLVYLTSRQSFKPQFVSSKICSFKIG